MTGRLKYLKSVLNSIVNKKQKINNIFIVLMLLIYLLFLSWRMFFYAYGSFYRIQSGTYEYNLVPFKTIYSLLINYSHYGFITWVYNLFGNIAVFIPLGFWLSLLFRKRNTIINTLLVSFIIILTAEIM